MRIGVGAAIGGARRRAARAVRSPAFGVVVLTPLVFAGAVGASAPDLRTANDAVTPLAAVAPEPAEDTGVSVVAVKKDPTRFHVAASTASAPPPPGVLNSPGSLQIPTMALSAYRNAERMMAAAHPECGVSWNLLAGIGRIESLHAYGGATDANGTAVRPIYGPALDGTLPGNEIIVQSRAGGQVTYARAMGPMQFLPGTWARYASDGDGDGNADVQNLYDSSLAAARYLCSGGLDLRDRTQVMSAILRYNNSVAYAHNVLSWAAGYATGVVPVNLPPITGSVPVLPIGATHLERPEGMGLGPGLPINATGLPADDPLALIPRLGRADAAQIPTGALPEFAPGQTLGPLPGPLPAPQAPQPDPAVPSWLPPWMQPPQQQECAVFCLPEQAPTAPAPGPPMGLPPGPGPLPGAAAPLPAPGAPMGLPPGPGPLPGAAAPLPAPGAPAALPAPGLPAPLPPPGPPAPLGPPPGPAA